MHIRKKALRSRMLSPKVSLARSVDQRKVFLITMFFNTKSLRTKFISIVLAFMLVVISIPLAYADEVDVVDKASPEAKESLVDTPVDDGRQKAIEEESPVDDGVSATVDSTVEQSIEDADKTKEVETANEVDLAEPTLEDELIGSTMTDEEMAASLVPLEEIADESSAGLTMRSLDVGTMAVGETGKVRTFSGASRYETAALQAQAGWSKSEYVIIVSGASWADALSASGLAGIYNCPILLTETNTLTAVTAKTIANLGVKKAIIVGGTAAVGSAVEKSLKSKSITTTRLSGADRYATQLKVYEHGKSKWSDSMVIVVSGAEYADALSVSPLAMAKKLPIFLTDAKGGFSAAQKKALMAGAKDSRRLFKSSVIVGGTARVSSATQGYLWAVSQISSGKFKAGTRIGKADRYQTSAAFAEWAVSKGYLKWDKAAFASGVSFADSLGGGALQGKEGSVLLLCQSASYNPCLDSLVKSKTKISHIKFFGGTAVVSSEVRGTVLAKLKIVPITYTNYNITLNAMANLEVNASKGYQGYSKTQILASLNPANFAVGSNGYYQFAVIGEGYSGQVSTAQLNNYISSTSSGRSGKLVGLGSTFIKAAKTYNLNEVYLLSNAILESGWGTSQLASGYYYAGGTIDGKKYPAGTYYNFFGIGAYDNSALSGGRKMAIIQGWNSREKAVLGAAKWISNNYVNPTVASGAVSGKQNTLYKMKWDINRAVKEKAVWHQYATGREWATSIASVMGGCYSYNGISIEKTGLRFDYPVYK